MPTREEIILRHAKSDKAAEQMRIADGAASGINALRDLMADPDRFTGGEPDPVADAASRVADIAVSQPLRWGRAEPILAQINEDLRANNYPCGKSGTDLFSRCRFAAGTSIGRYKR